MSDWGIAFGAIGTVLAAVFAFLLARGKQAGEQRVAEYSLPEKRNQDVFNRQEIRIATLEASGAKCAETNMELMGKIGEVRGTCSAQGIQIVRLEETVSSLRAEIAVKDALAVEQRRIVDAKALETSTKVEADRVLARAELDATALKGKGPE